MYLQQGALVDMNASMGKFVYERGNAPRLLGEDDDTRGARLGTAPGPLSLCGHA